MSKFMQKVKGLFTKPKASSPSDEKAQIAKRAHELYEKRGRKEGHAQEDWLQAEREIRKKK